jgi:hypothetical protein
MKKAFQWLREETNHFFEILSKTELIDIIVRRGKWGGVAPFIMSQKPKIS